MRNFDIVLRVFCIMISSQDYGDQRVACDGLNDRCAQPREFGCLTSSWWNCLEILGSMALLEEVHHCGVDAEVSKPPAIPSLLSASCLWLTIQSL